MADFGAALRSFLRSPVGAVVGGVIGPLVVTVPVELWLLHAPYRPSLLYIAFVAALAAVGGLRCGVIASITSLVIIWYIAFDPRHSLSFTNRSTEELVAVALVALCFAAVLLVVWRLDEARRRASLAQRESESAEAREAQLLAVARELAVVEDRDGIRNVLATTVAEATGATGVAVLEYIAGEPVYDLSTGYTNRVRDDWSDIVAAGTPAVEAATNDEPVFVEDAREIAKRWPVLASAAAGIGEEARAALPFSTRDRQGAVTLGYSQPRRFPPEEQRFLATIAEMVGSTLGRIDAVARSEEGRLALAFDAMLHGAGLHRAIRDPGGTVIDFEIRYLNAQSVVADGDAARHIGRSYLECFPYAVESGLFAELVRVVETGEPYMRDPWILERDDAAPVPLVVMATRASSDEVLLVMRDVSEREQNRAARERALVQAARDRAVITRLQDALLPEELPTIPGHRVHALYRPAQRDVAVGGDWYDVMLLPNGDVALAVGDVAGHGLDATATMVFARSVLRALLTEGASPDVALERLDAILDAHRAFVTCWIARYEPDDGIVTAASAGHLPAVVVRPGGASLVEATVSPPLGTGAPDRPVPICFEITRPSMLFVYTDGLVERRTERLDTRIDELTGRLGHAFSDGLADGWLVSLVDTMIGDHPADDDLCALAVVRV